ncbi:Photosystem II core complex proteins psbY [Rhynchospora pubera]|uniref:Photosystem II core complex proteins psbY n=1 Tax=Rhynchospora pubera TaxID=906938 RepID=A0AAV8F2J8_9POAL|nr:Photosystem II core complex proteins psbY [Rhynchospora pubera]
MAATTIMAMLKPKTSSPTLPTRPVLPIKSISLISLQNLPKTLPVKPLTSTAIAGVIFSALSSSDAAFAAQQIADIAEGDNRGLALLLPIVPAILWVLYNILQPALNQLNRMNSDKGFIVGLGLGAGLTAVGLMSVPNAEAAEILRIAEVAPENDSRGLLLLFVVAPAIGWVLYNILQPALNQLNRMRSN